MLSFLLITGAQTFAHPLGPHGKRYAQSDKGQGIACGAEYDSARSAEVRLIHPCQRGKSGQEEDKTDDPVQGRTSRRAGCTGVLRHKERGEETGRT